MTPLEYHEIPVPGKIEVTPTKPCLTQEDLSMAYTPGVADACNAIAKDPAEALRYTARGNLVAVVTNGTAVLGLGNIGPLAGKPVMEGKGVLFKRFADVDVFDIELNAPNPDRVIETVAALEPTFGGINLEDIKAPECFYIEEELKKRLSIPVFHDDQHGTAIITGAALMNALEITGKRIDSIRVVINGAGAAGIACAHFYEALGVPRGNMVLCDTKGVVYRGRAEGTNPQKEALASDTKARTLPEALRGADLFLGLSKAGALNGGMLATMNPDPVIFALANPVPEIYPEEALAARPDAIIATGRSDFANQVNNVLGFPFIFRGALDVAARNITMGMKIAAARALAGIAKQEVPAEVVRAYGLRELSFGREYLIPKPFDPRVFFGVSTGVAEAAVAEGVARIPYPGAAGYRRSLEARYRDRISRFMK